MADEETLDWSKLPPHLRFMAGPAERYGWIQFGDEIDEFIAKASEQEKAELKQLAHRLWDERNCDDGHALMAWVTEMDMGKHPEAARVEFLMVLLNQLGYC